MVCQMYERTKESRAEHRFDAIFVLLLSLRVKMLSAFSSICCASQLRSTSVISKPLSLRLRRFADAPKASSSASSSAAGSTLPEHPQAKERNLFYVKTVFEQEPSRRTNRDPTVHYPRRVLFNVPADDARKVKKVRRKSIQLMLVDRSRCA